MSEEDLELLLTLDDSEPEEGDDAVGHPQLDGTVMNNGPHPIFFSEGDWTCEVSRFTVPMNDPLNVAGVISVQPGEDNIEIQVCRVTRLKNGQIIRCKVFYA
jgi:hypothetical protein